MPGTIHSCNAFESPLQKHYQTPDVVMQIIKRQLRCYSYWLMMHHGYQSRCHRKASAGTALQSNKRSKLMTCWTETNNDAILLVCRSLTLIIACWIRCKYVAKYAAIRGEKPFCGYVASCPTGGTLRWRSISHSLPVSLLILGAFVPIITCELPAITTTNLAGFGTAVWPDGVARSAASINEYQLETLQVRQQRLEADTSEALRDSGTSLYQNRSHCRFHAI